MNSDNMNYRLMDHKSRMRQEVEIQKFKKQESEQFHANRRCILYCFHNGLYSDVYSPPETEPAPLYC